MPKHIKIMLIGHQNDQVDLVNALTSQSISISSSLITPHTLKINGEEVTVEFCRAHNDMEYKAFAKQANVLLCPLPGKDYLHAASDNASGFSSGINAAFLNEHKSHLLSFLIFNGLDDRNNDVANKLRDIATEFHVINAGQASANILNDIVGKAIVENKFTEVNSGIKQIEQGNHPQRNIGEILRSGLNSLLGAPLRAAIGMLTAAVVYNPVASLFAGVSHFWAKPSLVSAGLLLISPVWGPLKGIFFDGLYQQGKAGWKEGFSSILKPITKVPRNNDLILAKENDFKGEKRAVISMRNWIFSMAVLSLAIAAAAVVLIPVVSATVGLPAIIASLGLSAYATWQLALIAAGVAAGISSMLYGLGYAAVKGINALTHKDKTNSVQQESKKAKAPNLLSRFSGAGVAAVLALAAGLVFYNPIASVFGTFRKMWRAEGIANKAKNFGLMLLSPVAGPIYGIYSLIRLGIYGGYAFGFRDSTNMFAASKRVVKQDTIFKVNETNLKDSEVSNPESAYYDAMFKFTKRDAVAALAITALITGAVLAVTVPAFGIFLGVPALLTTLGLAGSNTALLAVIAGAASFVATTLVYGIGSQVADYINTPKQHAQQSVAKAEGKQRVLKDDVEVNGAEDGLFSGFSNITSACYSSLCGKSKASSTSHLEVEEEKDLLLKPTL